MGLVTPLGLGVQHVWRRICAGETAEHVYDAARFIEKANLKPQGVDFIGYARAAAAEAMQDAGFGESAAAIAKGEGVRSQGKAGAGGHAYARERFGVAIGSGIGAIDEIAETAALLRPDPVSGQRKVSPFFVPRILTNMAAGAVSMAYALRGPNHSVSTACATSAHAVGDAFRFIKYGDADAMLAGGTEASINELSLAGFCRAKALATKYNDNPAAASRPFDMARDGFVLGEGAGIVVLEELESARARGARIYAEIRGYGLCGDAHHITAPKEDGSGALHCMTRALREAGLAPKHIDYVNAHATSTPLGDNIEALGIGRLFGSQGVLAPGFTASDVQRAHKVAVSSTKGAIGHLLGAAGVVESIFAVLALQTGLAPPTANLENPDPSLPTDVCDFVSGAAHHRDMVAALSNSFGFGGTNCSLVFTKFEE